MSDDWRLRVELQEHGNARLLTDRLEAAGLEHDLETSFGNRVVVSRDGGEVFCYAGSREQAERAATLIGSLGAEHGWRLECELKCWHPAEEAWEDPDKPLPQDDQEHAAERAALMEREREEAQQRGFAEFEVQVQCPSHRAASELAEVLREEGVPSVRRSRYLLVGAVDEDSAQALAKRLRTQAPPGSVVTTEGTRQAAYAERPGNPFAVLGGMAG